MELPEIRTEERTPQVEALLGIIQRLLDRIGQFEVTIQQLREEIANHGVDPRVRGRVMDERLRAMIEIWTKDEAEFHGKYVDFDPIYSWPKPVSKPHTPLYIGGGPANFARITEFGAGWLSLSGSAGALAADLAKLRDLAGPDVPVIASHVGKVTAEALAGYRDLGIGHVTVELPTQPRDDPPHMTVGIGIGRVVANLADDLDPSVVAGLTKLREVETLGDPGIESNRSQIAGQDVLTTGVEPAGA